MAEWLVRFGQRCFGIPLYPFTLLINVLVRCDSSASPCRSPRGTSHYVSDTSHAFTFTEDLGEWLFVIHLRTKVLPNQETLNPGVL